MEFRSKAGKAGRVSVRAVVAGGDPESFPRTRLAIRLLALRRIMG